MISNKILWVLTSNKLTENPVNRSKVDDAMTRPVFGFRIVPTAERLNAKGSIYNMGLSAFLVLAISESRDQIIFFHKQKFKSQ
jgi:hypothetical protein